MRGCDEKGRVQQMEKNDVEGEEGLRVRVICLNVISGPFFANHHSP